MTRRFVLGLIAVFILTGSIAEADETVALRFFIVPQVTVQSPTGPLLAAKYINSVDAPGVISDAINYGREDMRLVAAQITPTQVSALSANLDVTLIPANLDSAVTAAAQTTIQNKLEGWKIPGDWVTTTTTYREVVGTIGRICLLMQRFDGLNQRTFFESGITLDTRVNQLTVGQRNALQNAAIELGLPTAFITGPMTVRQVLKTWVSQMGPFGLGGQTF